VCAFNQTIQMYALKLLREWNFHRFKTIVERIFVQS
jgi:hypothetical protein